MTVEIREADGRPMLHIRALTARALANDRLEAFEAGSLAWSGDVPIRRGHGTPAVLRGTPEWRDDRLEVVAAIPDTPEGRELAEGVRSGELAHASVEFNATEERRERGVRIITRGILDGIALTSKPAYRTTRTELRSQRRRVFL